MPTPPNPAAHDSPASDTVSQSEIEQLLAQVETANPSLVAGVPEATLAAVGREPPKRHSFPKLSAFSASELRPLRMRHEDFISALAARLSIHLGLEIALQMSKLEAVQFQTFAESLSNPTYLSLIKLPPLAGICLLDIPPKLAICIVDRELGGPGRAGDEIRQIGKMESRLLAPFVTVILNEWCSIWRDLIEIRPSVVGSEGNSRYLNTSPAAANLLIVGVQTTMGDTVDQMQLAFPQSMLAPLTVQLNSGAHGAEKADTNGKPGPTKWGPLFDSIEVEVKAQLPDMEFPAGQISSLKPGDVLTLPPEFMNQVRLVFGDQPQFVGTLGVCDQRRAVKIERRLKIP